MQTVQILDPLVDINKATPYGVLYGPQTVNYQQYNAVGNPSGNTIQFNIIPPTPSTILSRKIYLKLQLQLTLTGTAGTSGTVFTPGYDAFAAYPLSRCMNTINLQLNSGQTTINSYDIIPALMHYHNPGHVRSTVYSTTPSMLDKYQNLASGAGTSNNPLGTYGDNSYEQPRGAFPMTIVSNTNSQAVIQATISEPIFMSPLVFGTSSNYKGLVGVQTFNMTFSVKDYSLLWSHANSSVSASNFAVSVSVTSAQLLFETVSTKLLEKIPENVVYPYYQTQQFTSALGTSIASGASASVASNSIQLQSIPNKLYVYAMDPAKTSTSSDSYLAINSIKVLWGTNNYLSTASQQDLYQINVKNGYCGSWSEWNGYSQLASGQVGTTAGPLCLELGTDIGLQEGEAPGLKELQQLQVNVGFTNTSSSTVSTYNLYIVAVFEGYLTLGLGAAQYTIGPLDKNEILLAKESPWVDYGSIRNAYGGMLSAGNFWDDIKGVAKDVLEGVRNASDTATHVAKNALGVVGPALPLLGLGGARGNKMSKEQLLRKLKDY
jgi:hypothetical protein